MTIRQLIVMPMLIALSSPLYAADEGMAVIQDFGSKWQTAYNNGEPGKVADLYTNDAAFSSGVLGTLRASPRSRRPLSIKRS